eukprot:gene55601-76189_t
MSTFNIMRHIRLQLKSGYMKEEPEMYSFMKRYPPIIRSPDTVRCEIVKKNQRGGKIPYLDLYEKAVMKNPVYIDEKVYPAYWQNEPQALTLAKKQYALMKDGMSEELAYEKAVEYVNSLENTSYEEMMNFLQMLCEKGTNKPFLTDDSIAEELVYWKGRLKETRYKDLELGEQGEIDFFIQT